MHAKSPGLFDAVIKIYFQVPTVKYSSVYECETKVVKAFVLVAID